MSPNAALTLDSLADTIDFVRATMQAHPERDALAMQQAILQGKRRRWPVMGINHLADPEDTWVPTNELELPRVKVGDPAEQVVARRMIGMLEPLKMLNPVTTAFGLGRGTGTLITWFGIPLNPEAQDTPAHTVTMRQLLDQPAPDPLHGGMMPQLREEIELYKALTPDAFKIALPDMQGPFNLVASMLGSEAMVAMIETPDDFAAIMTRVTDLWLAVRRQLVEWIGPERMTPEAARYARIAECSVNMVSPAMYRQHVLAHDARIVAAHEGVHIHPCSGPHVFKATLASLPNVIGTEAGYIAKTAAGAISVEEALSIIGDRPIALHIGQELPVGTEEAFIRADLERYWDHPRLCFSYTGMHWRKRHRPMIRDLHRRLDDWWAERYG